MREVSIAACLNGWICRVGCQTVVFTSRDTLLAWLDRYMKNPTATEAEFLKGAANQHLFKVAPLPDQTNQRPFEDLTSHPRLITETELLRARLHQQRMATAAREDPSHSIGAERSNPVDYAGYESVALQGQGSPTDGDATGVR